MTDVISIAIAISALILTLYQMYASHRHNLLSVRPYLQFGWTAGETGDGIWMRNAGLGPAIVDKFTILQNGVEITSKSLSQQIYKRLKIESRLVIINPGAVIQEKDERWLIRPKDQILDGTIQEKLWDILAGLEFRIDYKSFYNKSEPQISWICPNPVKEFVSLKHRLTNPDSSKIDLVD